MPVYTETQQNPYRWHFLIAHVIAQGAILAFLLNQFPFLLADPILLIVLLVCQFVFGGFWGFSFFRRLDLRIDETGVQYRAPLAWARWQQIPWTEVNRLYVREYALFGEYPKGVLGLRQGPNGFAFAPFYGQFGLQIEKTTGGKVLLATQQHVALTTYIANHAALNPVAGA
ncbi:hypothetical protein FAES_3053 [Fibrella aestuarina BUZ 2]|uniref:Bacterial Pleckstrin homology domain-containing protein n=1 Tax=Fibrella aestuarina BUZ 2 TaxID=1166018 RepID=I0KAA9_9BACT|nr:hypothetical protein [Fibrella aestuarina]CCH01062.1 hypothetical protein FAES_3053 [Fibrella aestuarina BUZ 2]